MPLAIMLTLCGVPAHLTEGDAALADEAKMAAHQMLCYGNFVTQSHTSGRPESPRNHGERCSGNSRRDMQAALTSRCTVDLSEQTVVSKPKR